MHISKEIAKSIREVFFGKNWTVSNFKQHLSDLSWQQATTKLYSLNTIVALFYHSLYYVRSASRVLQGNALDAHDKYSFDHPQILSQADWEKMLDDGWQDVEDFANLVEQLPDEKLVHVFEEEKYGSYYRNLQGIIEHCHYHLGQIVIIKKMIQLKESNP